MPLRASPQAASRSPSHSAGRPPLPPHFAIFAGAGEGAGLQFFATQDLLAGAKSTQIPASPGAGRLEGVILGSTARNLAAQLWIFGFEKASNLLLDATLEVTASWG